jgi:hypothetical protein
MIKSLPNVIELHVILNNAHDLFLQEIIDCDPGKFLCGISQEFYMTPPTGQYGTLNYLAQAIALLNN